MERPRTPFENTYKMVPDCRFGVKAVRDVINEILVNHLEDELYDPRSSKQVHDIGGCRVL